MSDEIDAEDFLDRHLPRKVTLEEARNFLNRHKSNFHRELEAIATQTLFYPCSGHELSALELLRTPQAGIRAILSCDSSPFGDGRLEALQQWCQDSKMTLISNDTVEFPAFTSLHRKILDGLNQGVSPLRENDLSFEVDPRPVDVEFTKSRLRHEDGEERTLYWIEGEMQQVYLQLFIASDIPLRAILLKNWGELADYTNGLGRIVSHSSNLPERIIVAAMNGYNWPWQRPVGEFQTSDGFMATIYEHGNPSP